MIYPSIRIEGSILAPDILERLEEAPGQRPADFGLDTGAKVKDEIARAWADAQDYWRIFRRKIEQLKPGVTASTETRQQWIIPLLGLLGYQLEYQARGTLLNGKNYPISHHVSNRADTPIHIVGCLEPAGLDRKPEKGAALRMSAHAMVQEYLNIKEQLYGLVTNGRLLRLLRDSSRLVKLSYLEFDLDRIFDDGLFADFAMLFRLLHASRLPGTSESAAESLIERYHQDSLDSGARIREKLSLAVESAIRDFAGGFLAHPANAHLQQEATSGALQPEPFYQHLLRLIYRILFLMVIEERGLIFPPDVDARQQDIYFQYYSLQRLRRLAEKRFLSDRRKHDLWLSLLATFRLFEAGGPGAKLGIAPLDGDLFDPNAIGILSRSTLSNDVLLGCLRALSLYQHPNNGQVMRVNYAALNVEEFGSVYEGLLEYRPVFTTLDNRVRFDLAQGDQRAATGSHYTPDDLVQPLIRHSLDYLIAEKRKAADPEKSLLSLRVADIACGSGHILLAAARRIATELAIVRSGEDQPSPPAMRTAVRDVIHECIYGVDINPLAVELCKVALWLEAHNPGQPLNFLDHHIRCGNAIVGYVRREEVDQGVPDAAFATQPGDSKKIAAALRKENKDKQLKFELSPEVQKQLDAILHKWKEFTVLPERSPDDIAAKKKRFAELTQTGDAWLLNQIAAIPITQFYLRKTHENEKCFITDMQFQHYWNGEQRPQGQATAAALALSYEKRFFHWFLEFPEIMENGGFDCILGNPPYLGGQGLSGTYGHPFCGYVKWAYAPTGLSDLVVFFVRRIYSLIKPGGFTAFITTNSIKDGDIRKDGLEQVLAQGGAINFAARGIKWPGRANLVVSLVAMHKGQWTGARVLDSQEVTFISAYFEDSEDAGDPNPIKENAARIFQGSIFLGDGFLLSHEEADRLIQADARNREVIFPVINGQEVNSKPDQVPGRSIINFFDWDLEKARKYKEVFARAELLIKPIRAKDNRALYRERWWQYAEPRRKLISQLKNLRTCFVAAATTKYLNFSAAPSNYVFLNTLYVLTTDRWDLFAVVQSTLHEVWARKYSGALKQDLRFSPSKCFDSYPFPDGLWQTADPCLATLGEQYHAHRRSLMQSLQLGLTNIYNLFHSVELTPEHVAIVSKQPPAQAEAGYQGIFDLRRLHHDLDNAVRDAYGWSDLDLCHAFLDVETLPENDRRRYTISPTGRKEILRRLLALNLQRTADTKDNKPALQTRTKKSKPMDDRQMSLFKN
jgi:type I restriction-modification system DNA methylase subunit